MNDVDLNIVCYKWGSLYNSNDVNVLYNMVCRNLSKKFRFFCVTDNGEGVNPEVNIVDLPRSDLPGNSPKLWTFSENFLGLENGDLVVSLDIDIVIVGNIDFLADNPECNFVIAKHRASKAKVRGHGAVYRLRVGSHTEIWNDFIASPEKFGMAFPGLNGNAFSEQDWLESKFGPDAIVYFPEEKIILFRSDCNARAPSYVLGRRAGRYGLTLAMIGDAKLPGKGEAIVSFAGKVKPADVMHKHSGHLRRAPFVANHWKL